MDLSKDDKVVNKWGLHLSGELPKKPFDIVLPPWKSISKRLPKEVPSGITEHKPRNKCYNVLIWADEYGIPRGVLNHHKITGEISVIRDENYGGQAIGRKLVHETCRRWRINLSIQNYTSDGLKMARSALRHNPNDTRKE
jgi:hypothetical protein